MLQKLIRHIYFALLLCGSSLWLSMAAQASTVTFDPQNSVVGLGEFTVNIIGTEFTGGTDGGGVNVTYDAAVLQAVSVTLDPVWNIFASSGTIDNVGGSITGIDFATFNSLPSSFLIGTIRFNAVGVNATALNLSESFGIGGFALGGQAQTVTFTGGSVTVVPLPAAWSLMLGGIAPLGWLLRRKWRAN